MGFLAGIESVFLGAVHRGIPRFLGRGFPVGSAGLPGGLAVLADRKPNSPLQRTRATNGLWRFQVPWGGAGR